MSEDTQTIRNKKGQFVKGVPSPYFGIKGRSINPLKGKKMPEQWRLKLCKPKVGRSPVSYETRKKLSEKAKLRVGSLNSRWKGGKRSIQSARRRERIQANGGSHTNGEWETLKAQCDWRCVNPLCAKKEPEIKLTRDHIVSVKNGGSDNIENIQPLCIKCNVKKHSKTIKYA